MHSSTARVYAGVGLARGHISDEGTKLPISLIRLADGCMAKGTLDADDLSDEIVDELIGSVADSQTSIHSVRVVLLSMVRNQPSGYFLGLPTIITVAEFAALSSCEPQRGDDGRNRTNGRTRRSHGG